MALEGFLARVASIALESLRQDGFALGGGFALQAHGLVDRLSDDLDAYQPKFEREPFDRGQRSLIDQFELEGLVVVVDKELDVFRRITVSDPTTGESAVIDLGYDSRQDPPVVIAGVGPVASPDDSVGTKARALNDRRAARDYFDLNAILQQPGWSPERVYADLRRFRYLSRESFAADLRAAHEEDPADYAAYGMSLGDMDEMFDRLAAAAEVIVDLAPGPDLGKRALAPQGRVPNGSTGSTGGQFKTRQHSAPEQPLV